MAAAVLVLLLALWGTGRTAAQISAQPFFAMEDCLRGQELALHRDFVEGRHTAQALFLAYDEAVYVRAARHMAGGEVATDYLGDFFEAVRQAPQDQDLLARSPTYRLAWAMAALGPPERPTFVGYRSTVFAMLGVPIVRHEGCTSESLFHLRLSMLPWRAAGIVLAGVLAFMLAPRGKALAMVLASVGVAFDTQLDTAGATFMPDMPGATLLLAALVVLAGLGRAPSWPRAIGLGLLTGLAALVKADLIYVLPAAVLVAPLAAAAGSRRPVMSALLLAAAVHGLVLGAWAARNHALTGEWFVTSKDAINLYVGNTPESAQRHYRFGVSEREWAAIEGVVQARPAELKHKGPEIALRHHLRDLAWSQVKDQPWRTAKMFVDRLVLYAKGDGMRHFPGLGMAGESLQLLVMIAAMGGVLLSARASFQSLRPVAMAFCASLTIVSLVCYETRYLSHVFALALVIASVLLGTGVAAGAKRLLRQDPGKGG